MGKVGTPDADLIFVKLLDEFIVVGKPCSLTLANTFSNTKTDRASRFKNFIRELI